MREARLGDFLMADREADTAEQLRLLWGWGGGLPLKIKGVLPRGDRHAPQTV